MEPAIDLHRKVEDFLEAYGRESQNTARAYRNALNRFAEFYKDQGTLEDFIVRVNADSKLDYGGNRVAEKTLSSFIKSLQDEGLSRKATRLYASAVQSLFKYLRVPITLKLTGLPKNTPEVEMYAWKNANRVEQFVSLFDDIMYRTIAASDFQSGLALGDLLGLRFGDIKTEFEGHVLPLALTFTIKGREKTEVRFRTYVGRWTMDLLTQYLKDKNLDAEARLFPVTPEAVDSAFRTTARKFLGEAWQKGRNPCSPGSLRHAFRTMCVKSEVLETVETEYFMGHELGSNVQAIYLSRDVDDWRQVYSKVEGFLTPDTLKTVPEQLA
jgi:integrase